MSVDIGEIGAEWVQERKEKLYQADRRRRVKESFEILFGFPSDEPKLSRHERIKKIIEAFHEQIALYRMARELREHGPMRKGDMLALAGYDRDGGRGRALGGRLKPLGIVDYRSKRDKFRLTEIGRLALEYWEDHERWIEED